MEARSGLAWPPAQLQRLGSFPLSVELFAVLSFRLSDFIQQGRSLKLLLPVDLGPGVRRMRTKGSTLHHLARQHGGKGGLGIHKLKHSHF